MFNYLERIWRILATGFCFSVFGIGGVVLTVLVFPLQRVCYRNDVTRNRVARKTVHYGFKFFVTLMSITRVISFSVIEQHRFAQLKGQLVLANHPSLIDVVVLISVIPNADCVVKAHLFRNPFIRGVIQSTGYISNESPEGLLQDCEQSLRAGNNLIVFPEGTRTTPGQALHFKRGAANIALRCQAPISLVGISMQPSTLTKSEAWYQVAKKRAHFKMWLSDSILDRDVLPTNTVAQQARQLTQKLEAFFKQELITHE